MEMTERVASGVFLTHLKRGGEFWRSTQHLMTDGVVTATQGRKVRGDEYADCRLTWCQAPACIRSPSLRDDSHRQWEGCPLGSAPEFSQRRQPTASVLLAMHVCGAILLGGTSCVDCDETYST